MARPLTLGSCLPFIALGLLAAPAAGGVIRIAEQPALGPFTTLQAAVNAAPEGALLLVEAGSYGAATIDGKSLSIVAMPTSGSKSGAALTIKNLSEHQVVLLSGMSFSSTATPGMTLTGNAGHVRIQGCTITGGKNSSLPAHPGLLASGCPKVVLSGCTLKGGAPGFLSGESPVAGGNGLESTNSAIALFDSTLTGGTGSEEGSPSGGKGGIGCHVTGWGIFASGSTFRGGNGGGGDYIGCTTGGSGGTGLHVVGAQAVLLDTATSGGSGGWSPCNQYGGGGLSIQNDGGVVSELPGARRKLTGVALASDADSTTLTLTGQPGDRLFLLTGFVPAYVFMPGLGVWTVRRPVHVPVTPLGIVGPSGTLSVVVPTAHLSAGKAHGIAFLQGVVHDLADKAFLTSALQVELLDRDGGQDCNANLVNDFVDLLELASPDCNKNVLPDECDIAVGFAQDCNLNAVPDACEIATGAQKDCNANGVPDACDIASGVSQDCNGNAKPDSCDIAGGASLDVNGNGLPDECESHVPVTLWVDPAAPAGGNGSEASPFQAISQGIGASFHGDTVMLRNGIYTGAANRNLSTAGREIVIRSQGGAANCVIDCQGAARAFRIDDGEGPNCKLMGLTIRNGDAAMSPSDQAQGGGIYVRGASPMIVACVIEACSGRLGGGIYASTTSLQVRACTFVDCVAPTVSVYSGQGGGAYVSWSGSGGQQTAFVDTVFRGCSAAVGGGLDFGSDNNSPNPALILSHCAFLGNTASGSGGGLRAANFSNGGTRVLLMENCLVAGNSAHKGAGAALTTSGSGSATPGWTFSGCTFAHNAASVEGGTLWFSSTSSFELPPIELLDSILWGDSAPVGVGMFQNGPGTVEVRVSSSDVEFGTGGFDLNAGSTLVYDGTNFELDPFFADEDGPDNDPATVADNDYRLAAGSPCADAGDNTLVAQDLIDFDVDGDTTEPAPLDLAKSPRFVDDPLAPDTGQGSAPLVDIGAYERP